MNKIIFKNLTLICLLSLGFISCNNNTKVAAPAEAISEKAPAPDNIDADQSLREALENQSPYTLDQLKSIVPQELIGAKIFNSEAKSNMGAAFASANYVLNDSASIELNIFDCAGPEGAGIYDRQYLALLKSDSPDEATRFSVVDFKGAKAVIQENKKDDISNFTCLVQKRFLVMLEGKFISIEQLKQAAASINFPK